MLQCYLRVAYMHMFPTADEGGPAGDTGSAMHRAAAAFHVGKEVADCLAVMQGALAEYPLADLADAAAMFLCYAADSRNRGVDTPLVEADVSFWIVPAAHDTTKEAIYVKGRLDQVRRHADGKLRAWDIKTSKKDPQDILHQSTYQMAAYCVGAAAKLEERVDPGGIIMPRLYTKDLERSPVFRYFPWTFEDCEHIMEAVRCAVADVRAGRLRHFPSQDCRWCVLKSPDLCLPKLIDLRTRWLL